MKTQAVPRAPLLALLVPCFFAFLAPKLVFPAQGTFSSCQMGLFVHGLCPLPGLAPGKSASPYLVPRGELTSSILHGTSPTSRVETPFPRAASSPPQEFQPQAWLGIQPGKPRESQPHGLTAQLNKKEPRAFWPSFSSRAGAKRGWFPGSAAAELRFPGLLHRMNFLITARHLLPAGRPRVRNICQNNVLAIGNPPSNKSRAPANTSE